MTRTEVLKIMLQDGKNNDSIDNLNDLETALLYEYTRLMSLYMSHLHNYNYPEESDNHARELALTWLKSVDLPDDIKTYLENNIKEWEYGV